MTACGFCALLALSRYTSGTPCTSRARIGKSLRTASTSSVMSRARGLVHTEAVVPLGLQLRGQLGSAGLGDAAVEEHVHEVGADVVQDARVGGDQQRADPL